MDREVQRRTEIRRRAEYKRHIGAYLTELAQLARRTPSEGDLLSLDATEEIRRRAEGLREKPCTTFQVAFEERLSRRFADFIERLYRSNSSPVHIWTHRSNSCGVLRLDSVLEFVPGFAYDVNSEGIIVLLTSDLQDRMTLEFSEDPQRGRVLDMELCGDHWAAVDYSGAER